MEFVLRWTTQDGISTQKGMPTQAWTNKQNLRVAQGIKE
jgi:hypothetical protein